MAQLIVAGNATPSQVLTGTTFSAGAQTGVNGSMVNNGAVTITPSASNQTITQGYHNGSGIVQAVSVPAANVLAGTTIAGTAGTMPNNGALGSYTPTTGNQAIPAGYTSGGIVLGDPDLVPANIALGKDIFGVVGTMQPLIYINLPSLKGENSTTQTVKKSVTMNMAGTVTVSGYMRNPNNNGDVYGIFRKNGVQIGTNQGVGSGQTGSYWSVGVSVVAGDVIDCVTWSSNSGAYNGIEGMEIKTTLPASPTGGTVTLGT